MAHYRLPEWPVFNRSRLAGFQRSLTFRAGAVRLVIDEHRSIAQVARELDLTESALRLWVDRARADRGKGRPGCC